MRVNVRNISLKYRLRYNKVVHVGAHWGQEYNVYKTFGAEEIVFIEPCHKAFNILQDKFGLSQDVLLINVACGSPNDYCEMEMFTGDETINSGMSNSLLKPKKHLEIHPDVEFSSTEIVAVRTLDYLLIGLQPFDLLVLDCQGYEGKVLQGATETLKNTKYILTEVNKTEVYEGCAMIEEIDMLLKDFQRIETGKWIKDSWTDAFYIRKDLL